MSSRIEEVIEEIEEYIEDCKFQPLSNTKIIVNKDEIESLLEELRDRTPEEIRKYQKIISNKEAILADAQAKADAIIEEAQIETNEMVSEHQIMQQAYAQANEIVSAATEQANEIVDSAAAQADELRLSAMSYVEGIMADLENILSGGIGSIDKAYQSLMSEMSGANDALLRNHEELSASFRAYTEPEEPAGEPELPPEVTVSEEDLQNA